MRSHCNPFPSCNIKNAEHGYPSSFLLNFFCSIAVFFSVQLSTPVGRLDQELSDYQLCPASVTDRATAFPAGGNGGAGSIAVAASAAPAPAEVSQGAPHP